MDVNKVAKKSKVYQMASVGLMSAILCVLGPLSIPLGLLPISFTMVGIFISLYILGMKKGSLSLIIYLLLGFIGLPVFSGFTSGPGKLFGPTGGYLIGFIFMALVAGFFIDRFYDKWYLCVIGMVLATGVCYIFGTAWLAYQANLSIKAALAVGVIPFIPGDLVKIIVSAYIGGKIRNRLIKADLFDL